MTMDRPATDSIARYGRADAKKYNCDWPGWKNARAAPMPAPAAPRQNRIAGSRTRSRRAKRTAMPGQIRAQDTRQSRVAVASHALTSPDAGIKPVMVEIQNPRTVMSGASTNPPDEPRNSAN